MQAHIEIQDGTIVKDSTGYQYPYQLQNEAQAMAKSSVDPQVYVFVWLAGEGTAQEKEVRKKFFSETCWDLETYALEMFEDMCATHDWYYQYSDDHSVYRKGADAEDRLKRRYTNLKSRGLTESAEAIYKKYARG